MKTLFVKFVVLVVATGMTSGQRPPTVTTCYSAGSIPFADPLDCTKYYQCFLVGPSYTLLQFDCPPGGIWDDVAKGCVEGTCSGATTPPAIVQSTTTARPVPTVGPTTRPPPPTPAPTTSPPPSGGNTCLSSGTFAGPSCDSYYVCVSRAGRLYKYDYKCPAGSYFSSSISRCMRGSCQ